jgi:hypothetical protein
VWQVKLAVIEPHAEEFWGWRELLFQQKVIYHNPNGYKKQSYVQN